MELVTLKRFAEEQKISYEAVRRQVNRYAEELSGHVIRQDRVQYLDEEAVAFLKEKRKESPIILMNVDQSEENERLREQIETLRVQLMTAQNELLKSQEERLRVQDRVIELQDEAKKTIEDRAKYTALLEDNKAKEAQLQEAGDQIRDLKREREADQKKIEDQDGQIQKMQDEAADLRRRSEEDQKKIEDLQRERDEAQTEAQSFQKSIFGFYRKR